jgi:polyhydroxyalkanoate synthesis regulator phasin
MITIEVARRLWWLPLLFAYTMLVMWLTYRVIAPTGAVDSADLTEDLREAHEEELTRLQALQDKELADRDRILDEYHQEIQEIRSDYRASVAQSEAQVQAQRVDILRRIAEDPDDAAQILSDRYGLVYVP